MNDYYHMQSWKNLIEKVTEKLKNVHFRHKTDLFTPFWAKTDWQTERRS